MSAKKLDGTFVSKILYKNLQEFLKRKNKLPKIVDISIGNDFGGKTYANMKKNKIKKETGLDFKSIHYDQISHEEILALIDNLNNDDSVNGYMIQLPLPDNLKMYEREILDNISIKKDIDCLSSFSMINLINNKDAFISCTAKGIITLLKAYDIELKGKNVCIINRSNIIGKPLFYLFLDENSTVTVCHSKTKNLKEITNKADIIVAALNKKEYITKEFIKKDAILIDVGVHKNENNEIVGDINYNECEKIAKFITPPTGGVGPMTICMLCYNSLYSIYGNEIVQILQNSINEVKEKLK